MNCFALVLALEEDDPMIADGSCGGVSGGVTSDIPGSPSSASTASLRCRRTTLVVWFFTHLT
jgi:hypothetical protein